MTSYVNTGLIRELFTDVEMKPGSEDRIQALMTLRQSFVDWTIRSLERLAYDLGEQGWTVRQIADELDVPRTSVAKMAAAYALRTGRLSPFPQTRSYAGAVDISRLVSRALREREEAPEGEPLPPHQSGDASQTTA